MARVVVDANVLIAARLTRDQNHDRGRAIAQAADRGDVPTGIILREVLTEVSNYLQARAGHDTAVETLDALVESAGFEIEETTKSDVDTGRSLFRQYEQLSLTDAIIVAAMLRRDLSYLYSFDSGFDAVDEITRLTTPDNPFGHE